MTDSDGEHSISLEEDLHAKIQRRVEDSEFEDVQAYVEFVLDELLRQLEGTGTGKAAQDDEVRDRLRELGYLE